MFISKIILLTTFLIMVNLSESANLHRIGELEVTEDIYPEFLELARAKRQAISTSLNPSGGLNTNFKVPLAGNDKNILSGLGSVGVDGTSKLTSVGGGLALDNINGHGASLTGRHIPGFGDQLTGAGHVNLLNTDNHRVDANAFATRSMPSIPNVPDFNTYGGGVDYMYKDKIGGSLGIANTPLFDKTDYSAMGNLNLFKNPTTSLDLNAGFSKSVSPYISNPSWEPSAGVVFTKRW